MSEYKELVDRVLFRYNYSDKLFKEGIKPYHKDSERFKRALSILKYPKKKIIYEFGPYPGTGIYYFGEHNKIIGVGNSNDEFERDVKIIGHELIALNLDVAKEFKLSNRADIVLVMEVLEHVRMPYMFLKNITNLVDKGGYVYLTTNNSSYIGYIAKLLMSKPILDSIETEGSFYPGHCRYYSLNELLEVFNNLGFDIINANQVNFLPHRKLYKDEVFGFFKNLFVKIFSKKFSTHVEILARKN